MEVQFMQRRDTCRHCGSDMRSCMNCRFWDNNARMCREGHGDFIRERDKANFCSQFQFDKKREQDGEDKAAEAKARLENLFKNL
jgi:hypothetical protein